MSNSFHPYKKRFSSNNQGNKKVIKKIKNHIDKEGSLESSMKPVKFIFQTNDTHTKNFDSPPTPTVNSLFTKTNFTIGDQYTQTSTQDTPLTDVSTSTHTTTATSPKLFKTAIQSSHSQTGFSFDSPTVRSIQKRSTTTNTTNTTNTTSDNEKKDYTFEYIRTLEENNRFLHQIQSTQRRMNYQNKEILKLRKKISDLTEIVEDRENEIESVRSTLSEANNQIIQKDNVISEWERWYDINQTPFENITENKEYMEKPEEYREINTDDVRLVQDLPKKISGSEEFVDCNNEFYEQNLQNVAENVADSVLQDVVDIDINNITSDRWADIVEETPSSSFYRHF